MHTRAPAVGTPAAAITDLENALEPSSCAAAADGPKTGTPAARITSATPATSGASGPTTTRSAPTDTASAAIATPIWLPIPPSTTIERIVADSRKVNDSGEMKPWRAAKNEPAKPANIAPRAKAVSFVLVVLIPSDRHAISSSRSASQARPTGNRLSRTVT